MTSSLLPETPTATEVLALIPEPPRAEKNVQLQQTISNRAWEDAVPWFLTIASTLTLGAIAWFLVDNILWFRQSAMSTADVAHTTYRLHVYHLHLAMIKRSVGLFSGFALLFLGTAVVFYSMRTQSTVNVGSGSTTAGITSASPGLVGMALGVLLLLGTIASKDEFPNYLGEASVPIAATSEKSPMVVVPFSPKDSQ